MAAKSGQGKQRGQGEGALYYSDTLGRWVGWLDLGTDAAGKRRRKKITGKTRAEVQTKMRNARRELDQGREPGNARETVKDLLSDYLARGLPPNAKSPNTKESYRWAIEHHLIPGLGARKVNGLSSDDRALSADDVDGFLQRKAAAGYGKSSIARLHQVLKRALRWGERHDRVGRNVAELVDTPEGGRRESKALTVEQARALLTEALRHRLGALFAIGLTVPSRPGELTGLCWDCVDLDNGVIHFRRALHRNQVTKELELGELKTAPSRRSVEVPDMVTVALKHRHETQTHEHEQAGAKWNNEYDLVFTTDSGKPIDPANLRRTLNRVAGQAGVSGRWTVYELRHTAVSALSHAGVQLEEIADAAGHSNSRVTAIVYRHDLKARVTSARAPMEALYQGVETPE